MENLHLNAVQIFEGIIAFHEWQQLENHHVIDKPHHLQQEMTVGKLDNVYLKDAVGQLKLSISEPFAIYLFGHHVRSFFIEGINDIETKCIYDEYFDLLVVSKTDIREQVGNIQVSINQDQGNSASLLSFTQAQIQKQLDNNNPFFHRALQYIDALYCAQGQWLNWEFHTCNGCLTQDEVKEAKRRWYQRENSASGYYNGGKAIEHSE